VGLLSFHVLEKMIKGTSFATGGQASGTTRKNGEPKENQFVDGLLFGQVQRRSTSPQDLSFSGLNASRSGYQGTSSFVSGLGTHTGSPASHHPGETSVSHLGQLALASSSNIPQQDTWLAPPASGMKEAEPLLDDDSYQFGAPSNLGLRQRRYPHSNDSPGNKSVDEEDEAPPTRSLLDGGSLSHTAGAPDSLASRPKPLDAPTAPPAGSSKGPLAHSVPSVKEKQLRTALKKGGTAHLNLAMTAFEQERWGRWVVAFGFNNATEKAALADLQACGRVQEQHSGQGNWLFIRYETRLQAEKALCRNGILLTPNIMLGVCRLDNQMASRLNFRLDKGGTGVQDSCPPKEKGAADILKRKRQFLDDDDDDILIKPKKKEGVCTRITKYLFNW